MPNDPWSTNFERVPASIREQVKFAKFGLGLSEPEFQRTAVRLLQRIKDRISPEENSTPFVINLPAIGNTQLFNVTHPFNTIYGSFQGSHNAMGLFLSPVDSGIPDFSWIQYFSTGNSSLAFWNLRIPTNQPTGILLKNVSGSAGVISGTIYFGMRGYHS